VEHGDQFDPTPYLDKGGGLGGAKRSFPLLQAQIFGALRFSYEFGGGTGPPPCVVWVNSLEHCAERAGPDKKLCRRRHACGFGHGDFSSRATPRLGKTKPVLLTGATGPAVIVIHEVYGFTPTLARFCRWVCDAGFRVYAPILFGSPDAGNAERPT